MPAGEHIVRWTYSKDASDDCGVDGAWLGGVEVSGGSGGNTTTTTGVPFWWLDEFFPGNNGNYETLANGNGSNNIPVWHSYVAGLNPTNKTSRFTVTGLTFTNNVPYFTWSPDLRPSRKYEIEGKTNLADKAAWHSPTNSGHRFFRVNVKMAE